MHDAMANRSGVMYGPYTQQQREQLRGRVQDFLSGTAADGAAAVYDAPLEPLELSSLRHVREILYATRVSPPRAGQGHRHRHICCTNIKAHACKRAATGWAAAGCCSNGHIHKLCDKGSCI